jgi:hypothetical protein
MSWAFFASFRWSSWRVASENQQAVRGHLVPQARRAHLFLGHNFLPF